MQISKLNMQINYLSLSHKTPICIISTHLVGSLIFLFKSETGETIWVCPACGDVDDGIRHMIACDDCDEWYHW